MPRIPGTSAGPVRPRNSADPTLPIDFDMASAIDQMTDPRANDPLRMDDIDREMASMLDNMENILPAFPSPPGWHICWLSETSDRDPIPQRERWGYVPYLISELPPGWRVPLDVQSANAAPGADGKIRVREMVLYKIPTVRFEAIMRINHEVRPTQMIEALDPNKQANLQQIKDRNGTPLIRPEGDGFQTLAQRQNRRRVSYEEMMTRGQPGYSADGAA